MTTKQERRFVRTKQRQRTPDFVRKAGPHGKSRPEHDTDLEAAIAEWADDMNNVHSVFED